MSAACVLLGVSLFVGFILPTVKRLQCELSNVLTEKAPVLIECAAYRVKQRYRCRHGA